MSKQWNIKLIEPWIGAFIASQSFFVLRDKKTKRALGVSYTEDGLKWIVSRNQRLLYFKDAFLKINPKTNFPEFKGDLSKSDRVIVEKFIPRDFLYSPYIQSNEYRCVDKALRMSYIPFGIEEQLQRSAKARLTDSREHF